MKIILSLLSFVLLVSFMGTSDKTVDRSSAAAVKALHSTYFTQFQTQVDTLAAWSQQADEASVPLLQQQVIETRKAYKRIEFLFDYFRTKYAYFNVNGGPLFKLDEDRPHLPPVKPNGLQALDELIFSDEAAAEMTEIATLSQELKKSVAFIARSHFSMEIDDPITIEAMRSGLVRVFSLGVSGFDTPGSVNALEEAKVSLEVMQETFRFFEQKQVFLQENLFEKIDDLFDKGIAQLERENDFETFDRMTFLKAVINPLYKELRRFKQVRGMETTRFKDHGHNYETDNLFAADFLNKAFYQEFSYVPLENPKTIALGKRLFFDPILSNDFKMSCASCHAPDKAFADGLPKSKSNQPNVFTHRNAPTLINAAFSKRFFYDLSTANLEQQVAHVVENPLEFNTNFRAISDKLNQDESYRKSFKEAYDGIATKNDINRRSISNALAAYVNSLVAFDSDFDKYVRNESDVYSAEAIRGFNLFMGKAACATCHFVPTFNGTVPPFYLESESEVLGVTMGLDTLNPVFDADLGRYENGLQWDKQAHFKNSFKTVSVRNVALTAPYMHNGSFATLEEVLDFYNRGGGAGMGLPIEHQTLAPDALNLNTQEQADIISFLKTLTDVGVVE